MAKASCQLSRDTQQVVLKKNKPVARQLHAGESHKYNLNLTAGQFASVVVEQDGIDVVVTIYGEDSKRIIEVDGPNGAKGPEQIFFIAERAGNYQLEVHSLENEILQGRYEIKLKTLRQKRPSDDRYIIAQRDFIEGNRLLRQRGETDLQLAVEKYESALSNWRIVGERLKEADTLYLLGLCYSEMSDFNKSKEYYSKALQLELALGDKQGEALTLSSLGNTYYNLRDYKDAYENLSKALNRAREIGDRKVESRSLLNLGLYYDDLGNKAEALKCLNQALNLCKELGDEQAVKEVMEYIKIVTGK